MVEPIVNTHFIYFKLLKNFLELILFESFLDR